MRLEIAPFDPLAPAVRSEVKEEADLLARLRGIKRLKLSFAPPARE